MDYLTVKWLHVLSSTVLFGTGIGTAFFMFFTNRTGDVRAIASVSRRVVMADWLFTAPTAIIQPATGAWLISFTGMPWSTPWIAWSVGLYIVAGACWLPVVWIQIRMAAIAEASSRADVPLPPSYWRFHAAWTALGIPAFIAFIAIFYLMVVKPSL